MNNQEYDKCKRKNECSGYFKSFSGGMLMTSLFYGNNILTGICGGLYVVGDIMNRASQRELNDHLREGIESMLEK